MSTTKTEKTTSSFDGLKWSATILLLVVIVVGNYIYGESLHIVVRVAVLLVLAVIALFIAALTQKGKTFVGFAKVAAISMIAFIWIPGFWPLAISTLTGMTVFSTITPFSIALFFLVNTSMTVWLTDIYFQASKIQKEALPWSTSTAVASGSSSLTLLSALNMTFF